MMASTSFLSTPPPPSLTPNRLVPATLPPLTVSFRRKPIKTPTFTTSIRASVSVAMSTEEEEVAAETKIGSRVRVTVPSLKVYHVVKAPEIDLAGREGSIKQYVGVWKGKRISANFPFKVEFVEEVEGKGKVKFFAHLREDEFEYLD